ncbi:MAG: flagellar assembly protein J [Methanomassiliicoccales archaeon PtaU1.Bin124]|nr:MAG: flagellar assembly protein J [Methanomassiliicoccales archaeon PtaU1.Bin124]
MKYSQALRIMEMDKKQYMMMLAASIIGMGIVAPLVMIVYLAPFLEPLTLYTMLALPLFLTVVVIIWPIVLASQRKIKIDRQMSWFVTEIAALSTSDMSFDKIFYILSLKKEYGPLAEDAQRIFRLVKQYNVSAAESCRFVAARSPSKMENDFYSRLAHSIDVGEKLDRFMKNEHDIMMDEYVLKCEASLKDIDFLKEMFTGIITSLIFVCVFVAIIPLLGQTSVDYLMYGIIGGFAILEGAFVYLILSKVPKDDIWYPLRQKKKGGFLTDTDRILVVSVFIALLGSTVLAFFLLPLGLPWMLFASTVSLPILIPGVLIFREERKIENRDLVFGAFIRSLGRSSSVSGQTMAESVRKLALHKFGPLTNMVRNLSRRLAMHINPRESWMHFACETGSNTIKKFSSIYTQCVLSGSKPDATSMFISNNMFKILAIRKKRVTISSNFLGVLYGVAVALAFTMWVTVAITEYMSSTVSALDLGDTSAFGGGFLSTMFNASYSVEPLKMMVVCVIIIHAFFSSLMLPLIKGGHIATAAIHFVILVWIGALSGFIVDSMMAGLFSG